MFDPELKPRCDLYVASRGLDVTGYFGGGNDGDVWKSDRKTAIKVFKYSKNYRMELDAYQRLKQHGVRKIRNFAVPRLVEWDDELLVVEMDIVTPPCLIDFGKSYLDSEPDHSAETWAEHYAEQREIWEDKFNEVQAVLWQLRQIGIYYRDAKPKNIIFAPPASMP